MDIEIQRVLEVKMLLQARENIDRTDRTKLLTSAEGLLTSKRETEPEDCVVAADELEEC